MTSTRLLAAAVGLLVVLPLVFWGGMPGTLVVLVFALTVCLDEYARMAFPGAHLTALAWLWPASAAVGASALWAPPRVTAAVLALVVMGTMVRVTVDAPDPISLAADRVAWISQLTQEGQHGEPGRMLRLVPDVKHLRRKMLYGGQGQHTNRQRG